MPTQLAGFIALAFVLGLIVQLTRGEIRLYLAPSEWREVNKAENPRRFWSLIAAETIVFCAILGQALDFF